MADLLVTMGADIAQYKTAMADAATTASSTSAGITQSLAQVAQSSQAMGGSVLSASMKFQQMRSGLSAMRDGTLAFAVGGQRADMMLMAMGHHITTLVSETGSLKGAFSSMASSLLGPGGVILGLTIAYEIYKKLSKAQEEATGTTEEFKNAAEANAYVIQNIDKSYSTAISNVAELTENVKLAKQGFIDKNEVVKQYNDTLGKTMGAVDTLNQVEQKLVSGAPDYIKMMLYKAAATAALKEASDKALESAKIAQSPSATYEPGIFERYLGTTSGTPKSFSDIGKEKQAEEVAKADKQKTDLLAIFNKFQDDAAKIAAAHKWSFINPGGDTTEDKTAYEQLTAEAGKLKLELENAILDKKQPTVIDALSIKLLTVDQQIEAIKKKIELLSTKGGMLGAEDLSGGKTPGLDKGANIDITGGPDQVGKMEAYIAAYRKLVTAQQAARAQEVANEAQDKKNIKTVQLLTTTIGTGLTHAFESALNGTQSFLSSFSSFLKQLIEKIIAAAAAAAILAGLLSLTGFGGTTGSGFGSIFGKLSGLGGLIGGSGDVANVPKFATGGIFNSPTMGIFGEAGPEAIVTPQHLADFAGVTSGGNNEMTLSHTLRGADLVLWLNRANKSNGRTT